MKYVEVTKFGGPEAALIKEAPTPQPGAGDVLITVKAAGINFLDLTAIAGQYPGIQTTPFRPGFEVTGHVAAVGTGVTNLKVGDAVAAILFTCGGYASHVVVPATSAIPLPPSLDVHEATGLLVQGIAAYLLLDQAKVSADDTVLISGAAGGAGRLATQLARRRGARVIGLASAEKHEAVRANGAHAAIDYRRPGWSKLVLEATAGKGAAVFLDSEGDWGGEAFAALAEQARWIIYGARSENASDLKKELVWGFIERNVSLRGFNMNAYASDVPRALTDLLTWASDGAIKVPVTRYPLADVATALADLGARRTSGKIVLTP